MQNVEVCRGEGIESRRDSWFFMDITDYLTSCCTQFSENLEGIETQEVESGMLIKLKSSRKEIQILLDSDTAKKLIDGLKV